MNCYDFEFTALCPNGTLAYRYECQLSSMGMIHVERMAAFRAKIKAQKHFQEDLADMLRNEFQCRVVLIGWHFDVKVTCTRK